LTEALPVWSPDASKVATGFDADVKIYDAANAKPTQAVIRLREPLLAASRSFEQRSTSNPQKNENSATPETQSTSAIPASFNPIVRLEWLTPETLYIQTAYIRLLPNEPISTFQRWHLLTLSPQAAILR